MSTVSLELLPKRDAGQWWSEPWGLVRGCTHVSAGCNYCWLEVQSARFPWGRPHTANGKWNGNVQMQPYQLSKPVGMKRPQVFAVWSDLFHEDVSVHFIDSAWLTMKDSYWHTFVVLTKRPARMVKFLQFHERTTPNIILATSVGLEPCWLADHGVVRAGTGSDQHRAMAVGSRRVSVMGNRGR
jgi:protein gp37